jgi:hypothetical protein
MGYMHIENLYKNQDILLFKECYALEKIHGSSGDITWDAGHLSFNAGGTSQVRFEALFDHTKLREVFTNLGHEKAVIYGEVHGGSVQRMKSVYGLAYGFIVFDIQLSGMYLSVPKMVEVADLFGLEVVPYVRIPTTLDAIDAARDRPSELAERRGLGVQKREGVVLRPLVEVTKNNGERLMAKHKNEKYEERMTPQKVEDPAKLAILAVANAIAEEWVTPMRLNHVLAKTPATDMKDVPVLIKAMVEDVYREAKGEIVESREATTAIGRKTVELFKAHLQEALHQKAES